MKRVLMLLGAYDPDQHRGIARAARELGWHLDVSLLKTFKLPAVWTGDGLICSLNNNNPLVAFVRASRLPAVDLSIWRREIPLPRVVADNRAIGIEAAQHFLEFGHRHFAWFALGRNPVGEERRAGYVERLAREGLTPLRIDAKGSDRLDVVLRRLRALPRPCAMFARSDLDAAWLLSACLQGGLAVPDDVAILGVDNNALICENQPVPLSSINHDLERIGYEGAHLLDDLMKGRRAPRAPRLIRHNGVTTRASTNALAVADPVVRRALIYLEDNLRRSFGVAEVAAALQISRRQLEMRFRAALRCGVHEQCLAMRLKRAEKLLLETDRSVEAVSAETGFANAPHLSRTFSARYGMPPMRYRKQRQQ